MRIAIAGSGAMARYHLTRFGSLGDVAFVACYDRSLAHARNLAAEFSVGAAYDDFTELLKETRPDAVSIAVADSQHYELTAEAIRHGVPVFLEKPFTVDILQAEHLVELQERYRVPVMVNFSKINYPAVLGIIRAVRAGLIGDLRELDLQYLQSWLVTTVWGEWWRDPRWLWRISSSHGGGGALRDLGSHLIYLACELGGDVAAVQVSTTGTADRTRARGSGFSCDMNDTFLLEMGFRSGAAARITGSYAAPGRVNTVLIRAIGTTGTLEVVAEKEKNVLTLDRSGLVRRFRFAKVWSTYDAFITGVREEQPWTEFAPSARTGLAVQCLLSGVVPTAGR